MKQKVTKQVIMLLLVVVLSIAGLSATFIPIESLGNPNYSCPTQAKMYLDQDNDADTIPDYFVYLRSNFRLPDQNPPTYNAVLISGNTTNALNATKVYYYASDANVLTKKDYTSTVYTPMDNSTFYKASWVFPYNQWIRGIDTNNIRINFERPLTTGNESMVSIIYSYKYSQAVGYRFTHLPTPHYRYNVVADGLDFHGLVAGDYVDWNTSPRGNERRWSSLLDYETCKNYTMKRCGDGEVDTYVAGERVNSSFTGEVCDDGNNLDGDACNATCTGTGSSGQYSCGDEIINDGSVTTTTTVGMYTYGPTYLSGGIEQMEECDFGDLNGSDLCTAYCTIPPYDAPVDEAVNE